MAKIYIHDIFPTNGNTYKRNRCHLPLHWETNEGRIFPQVPQARLTPTRCIHDCVSPMVHKKGNSVNLYNIWVFHTELKYLDLLKEESSWQICWSWVNIEHFSHDGFGIKPSLLPWFCDIKERLLRCTSLCLEQLNYMNLKRENSTMASSLPKAYTAIDLKHKSNVSYKLFEFFVNCETCRICVICQYPCRYKILLNFKIY